MDVLKLTINEDNLDGDGDTFTADYYQFIHELKDRIKGKPFGNYIKLAEDVGRFVVYQMEAVNSKQSAVVSVILANRDLYAIGLSSGTQWWRFDADQKYDGIFRSFPGYKLLKLDSSYEGLKKVGKISLENTVYGKYAITNAIWNIAKFPVKQNLGDLARALMVMIVSVPESLRHSWPMVFTATENGRGEDFFEFSRTRYGTGIHLKDLVSSWATCSNTCHVVTDIGQGCIEGFRFLNASTNSRARNNIQNIVNETELPQIDWRNPR